MKKSGTFTLENHFPDVVLRYSRIELNRERTEPEDGLVAPSLRKELLRHSWHGFVW